jgi:uncharacterized protein (DUF1015 family)
MADVLPLRALHYDLDRAGALQDLASPPYDVIDPEQREQLARRSRYNVVHVDLPVGPDPYATAARTFQQWQEDRAVVRDREPALWFLEQRFTGPDGAQRTRRGLFARVRVEEYGAGRIRPHERTHPGPKEDRLNLTRATKANLSPIFALYDAPAQWHAEGEAFGEYEDADGTVNRLWRVADADAIARTQAALAPSELLIADGHHRYETARVYAEEIGGDGPHRYVLMLLVALEDPGLEVFPTHRLAHVQESERQEALATALRTHFDLERIEHSELPPPPGHGPFQLGYIDSHFKQAFRATLKEGHAPDLGALSTLDTALLEKLILDDALGLTEDDISHLRGIGYSRTDDEALQLVLSGAFDVAFFLRPTPVRQVREIAAAGVNMPPKSTYFFPKVPTGLLFHPLVESPS